MLRILTLLILLIFCSCNKDILYIESIDIKNTLWDSSQILNFEWKIEDTTQHYDFILNATYDDQIPTQNIYVKSISKDPDGQTVDQMVSIELLDHAGKPYGSCDFGTCSVKIVLASNIFFPKIGKYNLQLIPYSRVSSFKGIHNIGLSIEKTTYVPKKSKSSK